MTDATSFLSTIVRVVQNFNATLEELKSISDRIGADSGLSTATAAVALAGARKELVAADFDNLKVAIDLMQTLLAATNAGNVPVTINTGGTVKLAFYRML